MIINICILLFVAAVFKDEMVEIIKAIRGDKK